MEVPWSNLVESLTSALTSRVQVVSFQIPAIGLYIQKSPAHLVLTSSFWLAALYITTEKHGTDTLQVQFPAGCVKIFCSEGSELVVSTILNTTEPTG